MRWTKGEDYPPQMEEVLEEPQLISHPGLLVNFHTVTITIIFLTNIKPIMVNLFCMIETKFQPSNIHFDLLFQILQLRSGTAPQLKR